ncbi:MAG: hypothetical protein M1829_005345 [Trizodia sp. TS-e1964]|nr:MAG: hypothetical protein M1829_005345 [Trizodia sp. TS-e1964]
MTMMDLYMEKDKTPSVLRLLAIVSAGMILGSFILWPPSFSAGSNTDIRVKDVTITIWSLFMLVPGLLTALLLSFLCRHNWIFQIEAILIPSLAASLFGLMNVVYNIAIHTSFTWNSLAAASLALSLTLTLIFLSLTLLTARKLALLRQGEARQRDPSSWQENSTLLPEDELTRQQLLRLLLKTDADRAPSPSATQDTFHIDLPDPEENASHRRPRSEQWLARPPSIHEPRSRSRSASGSRDSLSPWERRVPLEVSPIHGHSLGHSPASMVSPRPISREMRRKEIELGLRLVNVETTPREYIWPR